MDLVQMERFAAAIDADKALAGELWGITEPVHFVSTVVRRARDHNIMLVEGEVWEAYNAGRLTWLRTQAP
jgi:hypothetical protein